MCIEKDLIVLEKDLINVENAIDVAFVSRKSYDIIKKLEDDRDLIEFRLSKIREQKRHNCVISIEKNAIICICLLLNYLSSFFPKDTFIL